MCTATRRGWRDVLYCTYCSNTQPHGARARVYTQHACARRHAPMLGRHDASAHHGYAVCRGKRVHRLPDPLPISKPFYVNPNVGAQLGRSTARGRSGVWCRWGAVEGSRHTCEVAAAGGTPAGANDRGRRRQARGAHRAVAVGLWTAGAARGDRWPRARRPSPGGMGPGEVPRGARRAPCCRSGRSARHLARRPTSQALWLRARPRPFCGQGSSSAAV